MDTTEVVTTSISFSEEIGYAVEIVIGVLGSLASIAVYFVQRWLKIQRDDAMAERVKTALENGMRGLWAENKHRLNGASTVQIKGELAAKAVQYVKDTVPQAAAHFGIKGPGDINTLLMSATIERVKAGTP